MSLKESMLDIAQQMEDDESDGLAITPGKTLRPYIRMIRAACKSAMDVPQGPKLQIDPISQHILEIEKAKAEFRKTIKKEEIQEEEQSESVLEIVSGPLKGDSHIMPSSMPVGAKTRIGEDTYQLQEDGKLHHIPDGKKASEECDRQSQH